MSFLVVTPDMLVVASKQLEGIGSALRAAHAATTDAITEVVAAGSDEVSTGIASVFSQYGEVYRVLSTHAAEFHSQFVRTTLSAVRQYQSAESLFYAVLAARQAARVGQPNPQPNVHDSSPAG